MKTLQEMGEYILAHVRRAGNFATAVVQHVAAGSPPATPELKAARLTVCSTCDQKVSDPAGDWCRHRKCGCYLETKAGWADQSCPLGKWPPPLLD